MLKQWRKRVACVGLLVCASISGCATAVFDQARSHYYAGDPVAGVAALDTALQEDKIPDRDLLLLHLERGLMLHRAGLFAESAKALVLASSYIDEHQRISVSEQTRSLLSNDWSKTYLGEYSERLWMHSYAMMSFIMAGDAEAAAVEARRAVKVLDEHSEQLQDDAFSRALIALSFELAGQYNDAYVSYRRLADDMGDSDAMAMAIYRSAQKVASADGSKAWRERIDSSLWQAYSLDGPEAVLLLSTGRGPVKTSSSLLYGDERLSFPAYRPSHQAFGRISVSDGRGNALLNERVSTNTYAVSSAALAARAKLMLGKAAVRGRIKHELVKDLRRNDQAAAEVLNLVFFLLEEADTRSWQSLPAQLTLLRVPLQPGQQQLTVHVGELEQTVLVDPTQGLKPQVFSLHF